jgi:hypothetical protein
MARRDLPARLIDVASLSFETFEREFIGQLQSIGLLG